MAMIRSVFLVALIFACIAANAGSNQGKKFPEKIILVTVNEKGRSIIGRDTLSIDSLALELAQRFWKSFTGTGKMQDAVKLQFTGEVPAGIRTAAAGAIKKAQENALIELCLQLHKKRFEDLSGRQQDKIRRQYPVLFQQKYSE